MTYENTSISRHNWSSINDNFCHYFKPAFQLDCYFYKSVSTEKAPLSLLRPSRTSTYNTLGTQCSIAKYRHSYLHTPL